MSKKAPDVGSLHQVVPAAVAEAADVQVARPGPQEPKRRVREGRPERHRGRSNYVRVAWPERGDYKSRTGMWLVEVHEEGSRLKMISRVEYVPGDEPEWELTDERLMAAPQAAAPAAAQQMRGPAQEARPGAARHKRRRGGSAPAVAQPMRGPAQKEARPVAAGAARHKRRQGSSRSKPLEVLDDVNPSLEVLDDVSPPPAVLDDVKPPCPRLEITPPRSHRWKSLQPSEPNDFDAEFQRFMDLPEGSPL